MGDIKLGRPARVQAGRASPTRAGVAAFVEMARGRRRRVGLGGRARGRGQGLRAALLVLANRPHAGGRADTVMPDPLEWLASSPRAPTAAARHRGAGAHAAPARCAREARRDARRLSGGRVGSAWAAAGRSRSTAPAACRTKSGRAPRRARSSRCASCGSRATARIGRVLRVHRRREPAECPRRPVVRRSSSAVPPRPRHGAPAASATASSPT